jgi:hypothetical protein
LAARVKCMGREHTKRRIIGEIDFFEWNYKVASKLWMYVEWWLLVQTYMLNFSSATDSGQNIHSKKTCTQEFLYFLYVFKLLLLGSWFQKELSILVLTFFKKIYGTSDLILKPISLVLKNLCF